VSAHRENAAKAMRTAPKTAQEQGAKLALAARKLLPEHQELKTSSFSAA
jgi:hypothetical protein